MSATKWKLSQIDGSPAISLPQETVVEIEIDEVDREEDLIDALTERLAQAYGVDYPDIFGFDYQRAD